jgi:hypothetical protein
MSQRFILAHDLARRRAVAAVAEAPEGYVITIAEPKRSGAINAALHAKLTEIAAGREWAGKRWPMEVWKRLLVAAWSRANGEAITLLPALDGVGVDIVQRHTSTMTQRQVSKLLSYVEAWDAEMEVAA